MLQTINHSKLLWILYKCYLLSNVSYIPRSGLKIIQNKHFWNILQQLLKRKDLFFTRIFILHRDSKSLIIYDDDQLLSSSKRLLQILWLTLQFRLSLMLPDSLTFPLRSFLRTLMKINQLFFQHTTTTQTRNGWWWGWLFLSLYITVDRWRSLVNLAAFISNNTIM